MYHGNDDGLLLYPLTYLYLIYRKLGKGFDEKEIYSLIADAEDIGYSTNYRLYQLLDDNNYLKKAYNQIQEEADEMQDKLKEFFLNDPMPKEIIEEWERHS